MKKCLVATGLAVSILTSALSAQQTIGFIAGLPDVNTSPIFTLPEGVEAPIHITLMTGPSFADAGALRGLSGAAALEALSGLISANAVVPFRANVPVPTDGAAQLLGGQMVTFTAGNQQIWVLAHTVPVAEIATTPLSHVALLTVPRWVSADPAAVVRPGVIMNTQEVAAANGLFIGEFGSIQMVAIPEPSTYAALFGIFALAGVMIRRRLRK